jgi:hypothetical protein
MWFVFKGRAQIPLIQPRASWWLTLTTVLIMAAGACTPYSPLSEALGFVPLPQVIRTWLVKKAWV